MFNRPGKAPKSKVKSAPDERALAQLIQNASSQFSQIIRKNAQATASPPVSVSWPSGQPGAEYVLVLVAKAVQRKGWARVGTEIGDLEWVLYLEQGDRKERLEIWRLVTGDVALILEMLVSGAGTAPSSDSGSSPSPPNSLGTPSHSWQGHPQHGQNHAALPPMPESHSVDKTLTQNQSNFANDRSTGYGQNSQHTFSHGGHNGPGHASEAGFAANAASMHPVSEQGNMVGSVVLSGNLREVDLPSILQSIDLCKMTGRLNLHDAVHQVEIFFTDGVLNHAISSHALDSSLTFVGEVVVLDVCTWDEGVFQFQKGWTSSERSIHKRLHPLLLEGATLKDHKEFLDKSGVTGNTVFEQNTACVRAVELESRLREGLPLYIEKQHAVFNSLEKRPKSLNEILDSVPMGRHMWIPVIFSLFRAGIILEKAKQEEEDPLMDFANIGDLVADAEKRMLERESGMFSYPVFLMFAEREFARYLHSRNPFCLAMLALNMPASHITAENLWQVASSFDTIKQTYDTIAYCPPDRVLILLPQIGFVDGIARMNSFIDALARRTFTHGIPHEQKEPVCGLIAISEGTRTLKDTLLAVFKLTNRALRNGIRVATEDSGWEPQNQPRGPSFHGQQPETTVAHNVSAKSPPMVPDFGLPPPHEPSSFSGMGTTFGGDSADRTSWLMDDSSPNRSAVEQVSGAAAGDHKSEVSDRHSVEEPSPEDSWAQLCVQAAEAFEGQRYPEAEKLWFLAYTRARSLPDGDLKQAQAAASLGRVSQFLKNYTQAESMFQLALDLQIQHLGRNHAHNVKLVDDLARCLYVQDKFREAESVAAYSVQICEHVFGEKNVHSATALYNLAQVHQVQKNFTQADALYRRVIEILQEIHGATHPFTRRAIRNHRILLESKGQSIPNGSGPGQKPFDTMSGAWQALRI